MLIDGFNLCHGLKAESGPAWFWLDLEKLSESLLKSSQRLSSELLGCRVSCADRAYSPSAGLMS